MLLNAPSAKKARCFNHLAFFIFPYIALTTLKHINNNTNVVFRYLADIPIFFGRAGFKTTLIDKSIFERFENVVQLLNNYESPIILRTMEEYSHMLIITGYGTSLGCNYILISNTDGSGENYVNFDYFLQYDLESIIKV